MPVTAARAAGQLTLASNNEAPPPALLKGSLGGQIEIEFEHGCDIVDSEKERAPGLISRRLECSTAARGLVGFLKGFAEPAEGSYTSTRRRTLSQFRLMIAWTSSAV